MSRPPTPDSRLIAWLEEGPHTGPDDGLSDALARARSTRQRPGWLVTLKGGSMETTWRARPVLTARLAFVLLIALLALSLMAGAAIVGGQLIRTNVPNNGLPAAALPPTACPAGTQLHSGDIATIAGTGMSGSTGDGGPAIAATVSPSYGMLAIGPDGDLFMADLVTIRRIGTDGRITTVAGPSTNAPFVAPTGIAFGSEGELYVADLPTDHIWKISGSGAISPIAGTGVSGSTGNGGSALAAEIQAAQVAVGPAGQLYFDDSNSYRTIDATGTIEAFAGTGTGGFSGDGGLATAATLNTNVLGVAADQQGNVYLGDPDNHRIRMVSADGVITTVAGTGVAGDTGDGEPAIAALIDHPVDIAVDDAGRLYFTDVGTNTVRTIGPDGIITTVAGSHRAGFAGDCGPATSALLSHPYGLAVRDGAVFIGDENNHRIRMVVP